MPWNHMQVEIIAADRLLQPIIGPGGQIRDQAVAEVGTLLDRIAERVPAVQELAKGWPNAKDNTVSWGIFTWTIYEYPDGEDPRRGALAWLEDFAATIRSAGVEVQIAQLP